MRFGFLRASRWIRPGPLVRLVAILAGAAAALWLVIAVTAVSVLGTRGTGIDSSAWADGRTRTELAYRILQTDRSPAALARARELARQALQREPANAAAARTLGLIAELSGDAARAERLLLYAHRLSRRDVPTQLWLIEKNVMRNDIAGALRHYDQALRVSRETRDLLLPILVRASADMAIARPLADLVSNRPPWWPFFAERLVSDSPSPQTLFHIVRALRLDTGKEQERELLSRTLTRLIAAGAYARAHRLFLEGTGTGALDAGQVRNGSFESAGPGLPPFDWLLTNEPELGAFRQQQQGAMGDVVLAMVAENARGGEVARQLLLLRPGGYRLDAITNGAEGDDLARPDLSLTCAGATSPPLARLPFPPIGSAAVRIGSRFTVPPRGCAAQWLVLTARSGLSDGASRAWIDQIAVRPL